MREFNIYNIAESKWLSYLMPSSAVFPDPRSDLCWSVVSAQDGSSHQIIIYGGYSPVNGERVADGTVWALSIPSFDWVQLSSGGTGTGYPGTRSQPACTTVGNKYMLVWGGLGNNCSKDGNAVYLFDISNREWVVDFTAGQDYLIPEPVVVAIGGRYRHSSSATAY